MPTAAELRAAYVEAGGERFPDLNWFDALTYFKEAALTSLLVKRAEKSDDPALRERMVSFTPKLGHLLDMATEVLSA
jgi:aminoglycoside phosphotransferase (APT) family kinase protein